jgi:amino acid adenylation domain-containing protein
LQEQSSSSATSPLPSNIADARRSLLEKYLRGEVKRQLASPRRISPRDPGAESKLSFAQERLWFLDQLNPHSAVYNVPLAIRLSGHIEAETLERSVNEIVRRHEVLRTTFATVDGQPVPAINPHAQVHLAVKDFSVGPQREREAKARALLNEEAETPFDLSSGPLIRVTLVSLGNDEHVFLVVMHHIVSDGWSLVLFFQELSALYEAFSRGENSPLAGLSAQYADYAGWQREWLQGEVLEKQVAYWKNQLGGELPVLELPSDRPRPAVQTFSGERKWLVLPEPLTRSVLALSQRERVTLFITLLSVFKVLLGRYTGDEDVIVGSPIANRPEVETESIIGYFLNNLALRSDLSGDPTFREVLGRVKKTALEAYANQDVPFEKLIDALKPVRDLSRTPIFQVYFNLFNFGSEIRLPGGQQTVSFVEAWAQSEEKLSKFDLTLYAGLHEGELKLAFVYNTDLYDNDTIDLFLAHFRGLLESAVADPQKRISELELGAPSQHLLQSRVVRPINEFTEFPFQDIEQSITDRFAAQVARYPEHVAVKTRNHVWSYAELNATVNRIAGAIVGSRGPSEERVALLFEHDAPMVAGMLASLQAGKTYVPLDPHHPVERLAQIVEHSESTALLTNNQNFSLARQLVKPGLQLINVDALSEKASTVEFPKVEADRLAYILYTSGSTGQPKGVMQNHRNVLHYIRVYTNNLHLSADDRLTLFSSYCFDASVMDIYGALLNGATLYPIDVRENGLAELSEQLTNEKITVYHSTPTVYRYFINSLEDNASAVSPELRLVVLGGEKVNKSDVDSYRKLFADNCLFVNGLGPTEATVTLQNFIDKATPIAGESVPVGAPVENTEILLLNKAGKRTEVFGEIAIKSRHVALGYWRNVAATTAAFSSNGQGPAVRIYRTGDMGRRLPDGSIKFEGRKDFQIKIRGFRVELGEIESTLNLHPSVREGVVVTQANGADTRLIAYVVPEHDAKPADVHITAELRKFLRSKLPEYMVPGAYVVLQSLPLTASGKLNRRALPVPETSSSACDRHAEAAAGTPLEQTLVRIWSELLCVKTVGVNDNFFELGGHSLLAVRLFAQIEKKLGKRLPLATLFQALTIAELAAVIQKDWTPEWSSLVAIQPAGNKPPFFCVHALGGNVLEYYDLARSLGTDQPFYGLQSQGLDGKKAPHTKLEDMATHYIKELRELQPEGPYFIGGRSLGGMVAFEMARQLREQGETIGVLALLDTYPSGYAKLFRNEATARAALGRAISRTKAHIANLQSLSVNEGLHYLAKKARFAPRKMKSQIWRRIYKRYEKFGRPLPRTLRDIQEFNSLAVREYVPKVYDGRVTLFWASGDLRTSIDLVAGWRALAGGGMEVHEIPGSHLDIIKEPHVQDLAAKLSSCLEHAQAYQPGAEPEGLLERK